MSGDKTVLHIPIIQTGTYHQTTGNVRKIGLSSLGSHWGSSRTDSGSTVGSGGGGGSTSGYYGGGSTAGSTSGSGGGGLPPKSPWSSIASNVGLFSAPPQPSPDLTSSLGPPPSGGSAAAWAEERRSLPKEFGFSKPEALALGRSTSLPPPPLLGSRNLRDCERELTGVNGQTTRRPFADITQVSSSRPNLIETNSGKFYVYRTEKQDRHCPVHGCMKERNKQEVSRTSKDSLSSGYSTNGTQVKTRKIEMKFGMEPLRAPSLIRSTSVNQHMRQRKDSAFPTETRKLTGTEFVSSAGRRHDSTSGTELRKHSLAGAETGGPSSRRRRESSSGTEPPGRKNSGTEPPGRKNSGTEPPGRKSSGTENSLASWLWSKPPAAAAISRGGNSGVAAAGDSVTSSDVFSSVGDRKGPELARGPGRFSLRLGSRKSSSDSTRSFLAPTFASLTRSLSGQSLLRPRGSDDASLSRVQVSDDPQLPPKRPLRRASSQVDLYAPPDTTSAEELPLLPPRLPATNQLPVFAPPFGAGPPPPLPPFRGSGTSLAGAGSALSLSNSARSLSGSSSSFGLPSLPGVAGADKNNTLPTPAIEDDVIPYEARKEPRPSREWPYSSILKTPGRRKSGMKHVEFLDNLSESEYVAREY